MKQNPPWVEMRMQTCPDGQSPVVPQSLPEPGPQIQAFTPPPCATKPESPLQWGDARKQDPSRHAPPAPHDVPVTQVATQVPAVQAPAPNR